MKILLTTHVFLPDFFGGTETLVLGVAQALQQRGHLVTVVTGFPEKNQAGSFNRFDEYEFESIHVVRFTHGRGAARIDGSVMRDDYDNPVFEAGFRRLLDEIKPDLVHFHHLERLSIRAIDACAENRVPAFLTATDFWYTCPVHTLLLPDGTMCRGPASGGANCLRHVTSISQAKWAVGIANSIPVAALRAIMSVLGNTGRTLSGRAGDVQALARRPATIAARLPLLQKIFVASSHAQRMLEASGVAGGKFRVLPFGIKGHGYKRRIRCSSDAPLALGFVGSMLPHKGLHVLLEAFKLLPADAAVTLKIYGKSPLGETDYFRSLNALASGDGRISFCGTFDNARIAQVLDGIDALIIPSLWHENMPLVSLSAQADACPLIASDIGGLADIVGHRRNGLLFPAGSPSGLEKTILTLLVERPLLEKLSAAAVRPMGIGQYVDELELEYRRSAGVLH
jgi:glycosyltransferase involved in cell wall biosynthesis